MNARSSTFAGIVGLCLLVFGLVLQFVVQVESFWFAPLHFILAALFLGAFFLSGGLRKLYALPSARNTKFGVSVTLYSGVFVAVLTLVNYWAATEDLFFFDSTAEKVFTLAPQTTDVLAALPGSVKVRAFYLNGLIEPPKVETLLRRLEIQSTNISLEIIDPERRPGLAERLGVSEAASLHFELQTAGEPKTVLLTSDINEHTVVNALLKLTRSGEKRVLYLSGHGEPSLFDTEGKNGYGLLAEAVGGENLRIEDFPLAQSRTIPADAAAVILAAPKRPLLAAEMKELRRYLQSGGRMLLLHEVSGSASVKQLAAELGIQIGSNVVVDQFVTPFAGPQYGVDAMVTDYHPHPITERFEEGTLFSIASSVRRIVAEQESKVVELAFTGEKSWAESDVKALFADEPTAGLDEQDERGPIPVVAAYQDVDSKARVVVMGDADFVSNSYLGTLFNRDFFLNALNWVVGDESSSITIRPRSLQASRELISVEQFGLMFLCTAILVPEALLLSGLAVWWRRRQS